VLAHESNRESEGPARSYRNWTIWFGKPDPVVLSILAVVGGVANVDDGALPLAKWRLT
jgi:hypothetical protein